MKLSFSAKLLALLFCSILAVSGAISFVAWWFLSAHFDRSGQAELSGNVAAITELKDADARLATVVAKAQAGRPSLVQAVANRDAAAVKLLAKEAMQVGGVDFVTISDAKGVVLARGHSDQSGDSVLGQTNVKKALAGSTSVGLEPGTAVRFSLRAGAPVVQDGKVVGVVTAGFNVTQDHALVDRIKRLFGAEATVFEGDTRVSTTIVREGKRAVGTKMDNPAVIEAVLKKGEVFHSRNMILGKDYVTAYWPIRNPEGQISGMLFIGKDREAIAEASAGLIRSIILASMLVGLVVLGLGALVARAVTKPIQGIIALTRAVRAGNLKARAEGRYSAEMAELKDGIESMLGDLRDKIAEADSKSAEAAEEARRAQQAVAEAEAARRAAEAAKREGMLQAASRVEGVALGVAGLATQLSASVRQISAGAESQRERVTETATAMEEMNATVMEVARNAASAAEGAEAAKAKALEGATVVKSSVTAIEDAGAVAHKLADNMRGLGQRATDIGRVLNVISDIADQTNLLALNAAIEAARAGDAGRGFAVVADEVRKLAEKTMNATKEVGDSIRAIQNEAGRSLESVDEAVMAVGRATELSEASGAALGSIVSLSEDSAGRVLSIASASEQQSAASEEINRAIGEVSDIAGQTAEDMQESAAALERLSRMTRELQDIVTELKA